MGLLLHTFLTMPPVGDIYQIKCFLVLFPKYIDNSLCRQCCRPSGACTANDLIREEMPYLLPAEGKESEALGTPPDVKVGAARLQVFPS